MFCIKYVYIPFSEETTKMGSVSFFLWMLNIYVSRPPVSSVTTFCGENMFIYNIYIKEEHKSIPRKLDLSNNKLQTIFPGSFRCLTFLKILYLSHTSVKKLENDTFIPLISLNRLEIVNSIAWLQ